MSEEMRYFVKQNQNLGRSTSSTCGDAQLDAGLVPAEAARADEVGSDEDSRGVSLGCWMVSGNLRLLSSTLEQSHGRDCVVPDLWIDDVGA